MADSAASITVRRHVDRVGAGILKDFAGTPTGFIVDAQLRRGALDHLIKPITTKAAFVGSALTVRCRPWDNLAAHVALQFIRPGDVVVIATGAFEQASVIGEKFVGMARNAGAVAIVTDGLARDAAGIDRVDMPVFARGVIPNSSFKHGPGEVGLPIGIGGCSIDSGDLLAGDRDGVVHVARAEVERVRGILAGIRAAETAMFDQILGGNAKPAKMAAITADLPIRYVD
jgi:4-hydroxy-4-methyl-2-oxoglutarate aldolase